jgi:hypothetical protein
VRKNTIGILTGSAIFTIACLCCPSSFLPIVITAPTPLLPSPLPVEPTALPTAAAAPTEALPVCDGSLEKVLQDSELSNPPDHFPQVDGEYTLVTYSVNGDAIADPSYASIPPDLKAYQHDEASQLKIWNFFITIIPAEQRTMVKYYVLYTDGINGSLGAVELTDSPNYWKFEMDIIDAANFPDLAATTIHEFGHLLTLNDSQVTTDQAVFTDPGDRRVFDHEAATCTTYFMYEGCSNADSYINTFFNGFWTAIYSEWRAIDAETDPDLLDQKLLRFYHEYENQFVSKYAATSPSEDLAESFMYFIFLPRPVGATISDQKILFYYQYPEMVSLRDTLRVKLCSYLGNP